MGETLEILKTRRSCRSYLDKPVPKEIVEKIVECGTYAATGMGRQSPVILVVENKRIRDKLSELNAAVMGMTGDPFYGAPQVIVVLADKNIPTYLYDGSLVMGNLMNAAADFGVSSCWIHRAKEVFNTPEGRTILEMAGITGDYEGIGNLVIGYDNNGKRPAAARKESYISWIK